MRSLLLVLWFSVLSTCVFAWTKEDYEIFDLVSEVKASEGKGTTFYSWLDVSSTASTAEISKAYRKKSIQLHPDKNPGVKGVHERFARLGVIAAILRNSESRKRYDFFYRNGVPAWRGTGYYYSRFRPGIVTVLIFLALLSSAVQYMVQRMNYNRDLARIETIIREAKTAASGNRLTPVEGQRKVRVNLGGGPRLDDEGNLVSGKMINMIVEGDEVYIVEGRDRIKVDASTAIRPTVGNTWVLKLFKGLLRRIRQNEELVSEGESEDGSSSEASGGSVTAQGTRTMAVKAGGMRRKAVQRRNR